MNVDIALNKQTSPILSDYHSYLPSICHYTDCISCWGAKTPPKFMTQNCIWWSGFSFGDLWSVVNPFIGIYPKSTKTWGVSTCSGPIFAPNISVQKFSVFDETEWKRNSKETTVPKVNINIQLTWFPQIDLFKNYLDSVWSCVKIKTLRNNYTIHINMNATP